MAFTDAVTLTLVHGLLLLVWIISLARDLLTHSRVRWGKPAKIIIEKGQVKTKKGFANLTITRGEESMNSLYVLYGVATVVFALCVQVAEAAHGYKVAIIVLDYLVLL